VWCNNTHVYSDDHVHCIGIFFDVYAMCVFVICLLLSASFASPTIVCVFVFLMVVYNGHVKNIV